MRSQRRRRDTELLPRAVDGRGLSSELIAAVLARHTRSEQFHEGAQWATTGSTVEIEVGLCRHEARHKLRYPALTLSSAACGAPLVDDLAVAVERRGERRSRRRFAVVHFSDPLSLAVSRS